MQHLNSKIITKTKVCQVLLSSQFLTQGLCILGKKDFNAKNEEIGFHEDLKKLVQISIKIVRIYDIKICKKHFPNFYKLKNSM